MADDLLVAGFDSGGTHTTCILATLAGEVVSSGQGGPGNLCTHPETAPQALRDALSDALRQGNHDAARIRSAAVGSAGYFACHVPGGPEAVLTGLFPAPIRAEIVPDIEIALTGAAMGGDAVVLIAGTGSVAYGGTQDGARARAGGWGYLLSDEGSAYWLGLQAIRAAFMAYDGRGYSTQMTQRLLEKLGLKHVMDLEGWIYGQQSVNTEVASLAPIVLEAAQDETAQDEEKELAAGFIVADAGYLLSDMVEAVLDRLDRRNSPIPVATVGGVLFEESPVREILIRRLGETVPNATVTWPHLPPVGGAILRALRLTDQPLTPEVEDRLTRSLLNHTS
jgi:N-acetylglucosamine kinase-like BadF-type ATPase